MQRSRFILVVEDNPGDAELARYAIEKGPLPLNLRVVEDGEQALQFLANEGEFQDAPTPDIILLDWNLPRLNGAEVLAKIKSDPVLRLIPVIVMTSSDAERDVMLSYSIGANCFVIKPLDMKAFEAVMGAIISFWFIAAQLPRIDIRGHYCPNV